MTGRRDPAGWASLSAGATGACLAVLAMIITQGPLWLALLLAILTFVWGAVTVTLVRHS